MKLWILEPKNRKDFPPGSEDPWDPWYDKCFGIVVRAKNSKSARKMANDAGGDENRNISPWLDPMFTSCKELKNDGEAEVVIQHIKFA
jgi:hypothetical protein